MEDTNDAHFVIEKKIMSEDVNTITFIITVEKQINAILKPEFDVELYRLVNKYVIIKHHKNGQDKV